MREPARLEDSRERPISRSDSIDETEEEFARLSGPQKLFVGLAVLFSFLFFSLWFLYNEPEPLARYLLKRYMSRKANIDFRKIDLNIFGSDELHDFTISTPDNIHLNAGHLRSSLGYWNMFNKQPRGALQARRISASFGKNTYKIKSADVKIDLTNVYLPPSEWNGEVDIDIRGIRMESLPPLPAPAGDVLADKIAAKDVRIKGIRFKAKINAGRLTLQKSRLQSNIFNIDIKGSGRLTRTLTAPELNTTVCLRPHKDLEKKFGLIFEFYVNFLQGTAGGQKCYYMKGVPGGNLKFSDVGGGGQP